MVQNFFYQFSRAELFIIIISLVTTVIALIAFFTALGLFRRHRRDADLKRMITILSSLDLLYYSLEKHVRAWKAAKGDGQSAEAQKFWRYTDLTELVTRLQELKVLSKIRMDRRVHVEITALLEFLGDLILISYRGEDLSGRDYRKKQLIKSDSFDERLNLVIRKVSRGLAMRNRKVAESESVEKVISLVYQS